MLPATHRILTSRDLAVHAILVVVIGIAMVFGAVAFLEVNRTVPAATVAVESMPSTERPFLVSLRKDCLALLRHIDEVMWQAGDVLDGFEIAEAENKKKWEENRDSKAMSDLIRDGGQIHNLQVEMDNHRKTKAKLESIIQKIEDRMGEIK